MCLGMSRKPANRCSHSGRLLFRRGNRGGVANTGQEGDARVRIACPPATPLFYVRTVGGLGGLRYRLASGRARTEWGFEPGVRVWLPEDPAVVSLTP